ncbi:hypothetical protein P171DRAFT_478639 [Karstenula rhodostoma CBS 690.94]|uniref:Uncharacterized protein n=1 Tax=Karstenula rhodostoma CBS 690.94 TaxID=1392251 RepID=A0A9P4PZ95_9PLEO|nr:hypothetical protein P171DRAFT_478639 [Karstenula rhodostoma CBS 690.94]
MPSILSIFLFTTYGAIAARTTQYQTRCGPSSNCESVIENGTAHHRFKRSLGPGSPDYVARFIAHEARGDPIKTYITMGKTIIGWGCDQPLGPIFKDGIKEVCGAHGCAEDTSYIKDVEWVDSDLARAKPQKRKLELKAKGEYDSQADLDKYIEAFGAMATPKTVGTENRKWCDAEVSYWMNGGCKSTGTCPMRMFPSFIKIARFQNGNLRDRIDVTVSTSGGDGELPIPC